MFKRFHDVACAALERVDVQCFLRLRGVTYNKARPTGLEVKRERKTIGERADLDDEVSVDVRVENIQDGSKRTTFGQVEVKEVQTQTCR